MLISSSTSNVSMSSELKERLNRETLSLPNDEWIQFLMDHRELIKDHSKVYTLTEEIMYQYRYRIQDYLVEVHKMQKGMDQAFRIVNRLYNDMDFDLKLTEVWVPDNGYIRDLRREYQTCQAIKKRI